MKFKLTSCFILVSVLFCKAQDENPWRSYKALGAQAGYSNFGFGQIDAGINYYWTKVKSIAGKKEKANYHTFGPSIGASTLMLRDKSILGMQAAMDYHYGLIPCSRINIAYENYFNKDSRIGADVGLSLLGIFGYVGYHYPVGKVTMTDVEKFRIGVRIIFNEALINGTRW